MEKLVCRIQKGGLLHGFYRDLSYQKINEDSLARKVLITPSYFHTHPTGKIRLASE